jgi:hypothetical protein
MYLNHLSSYVCSTYQIEIFEYISCSSGGQKSQTHYFDSQETVEEYQCH